MKEYVYGKLDLRDAHGIARGSNSLLVAFQEYAEERMGLDKETDNLVGKGVKIGDELLELAQLLSSRGAFSNEKHLSELLIYSAAVADQCEVCALTHIDGAIRAKAPPAVIDTVQTIALYIHAQADDNTYMLFDTYTEIWQRFEHWPRLSTDRVSNLKFYNLIALLMSLVVRKRRLIRFHTRELLTQSNVTPEEILEIVGVAQVMGGFPTRWETIHIRDIAFELRDSGLLPEAFRTVLASIPTQQTV